MIRETHEKLRPVLERRDHGFRWRGTEISRIEGLSDAVFAFAVTLLVEIYSAGFVALYVIFALVYWHSYRLRSDWS